MGIDAVALANNHTRDFGDEGTRFVLNHLHYNGYPTLGAGENIDEISAPISDDEELCRYFDGWALVGGNVYAGMAVYTPDMEEDISAVIHMKNDFSCEAHAEVVMAYLNLCYKGKEALKEAEKYKEKLIEKTKIYL